MHTKLQQFIKDTFTPYGDFPGRKDVEQELLAHLQEKFNDVKADGKSDEEAYQLTIDSFGDVREIMEHVKHTDTKQADTGASRKSIIDNVKETFLSSSRFRAISLTEADLAGTALADSNFNMSDLNNANFDAADLQRSRFKIASLNGAQFVGANLSDTVFDSSNLQDANLTDANLTNAKIKRCALANAQLGGATLDNTHFHQSSLDGLSFDGLTLRGTIFDTSSLKNATFHNATLDNVSFHRTNVREIIFDGATMDKVTYALLKGVKANLDKVTTL